MLDIIWRCDKDNKVDYVWFDTGLEYQATKDHLKYLEEKYGIEIISYKAIKPIPVSCKEYGQPFLSKCVSEMIYALQKHNFSFTDKTYEEMISDGISLYLSKWWTNQYQPINSQWNINRNKYLKEFLIKNPPNFLISSKCCDYAKKKLNKKLIKEYNYNLMITGIRKAEGGVRSASYKNCFSENEDGADSYRPIFWYLDKDKIEYENYYDVTHSRCYTEYGFKRTGCAGCPYNKHLDKDMEKIYEFEPKLYKAVNNIFKDSYEYTKKYKEFCEEMRSKEKK